MFVYQKRRDGLDNIGPLLFTRLLFAYLLEVALGYVNGLVAQKP